MLNDNTPISPQQRSYSETYAYRLGLAAGGLKRKGVITSQQENPYHPTLQAALHGHFAAGFNQGLKND